MSDSSDKCPLILDFNAPSMRHETALPHIVENDESIELVEPPKAKWHLVPIAVIISFAMLIAVPAIYYGGGHHQQHAPRIQRGIVGGFMGFIAICSTFTIIGSVVHYRRRNRSPLPILRYEKDTGRLVFPFLRSHAYLHEVTEIHVLGARINSRQHNRSASSAIGQIIVMVFTEKQSHTVLAYNSSWMLHVPTGFVDPCKAFAHRIGVKCTTRIYRGSYRLDFDEYNRVFRGGVVA